MANELIDYMLENIIDIPINLKLYMIVFFVIIVIGIWLHLRQQVNTISQQYLLYWFIGLVLINFANIALTILHYKYKQGTFKGDEGAPGDNGISGDRGANKRCNTCEEKIGVNMMDSFDDIQTVYVNNSVATIKRPTMQLGYNPIGYTIDGKYDRSYSDKVKTLKKKGYTLSGGVLKNPLDYTLIVKIPAITGKTNNPTYVWRAVPPTDYVALGDIVTATESKPPKNTIMCVPIDCVKEVDLGLGYISWNFNYQDSKTSLYVSLWDTPLNTFYCNYVTDNQIFNGTFYDNLIGFNETLKNSEYINRIQAFFENIKSPFDLMGYAQNINSSIVLADKKEVSLMSSINHYFPDGFKYLISVDDSGDLNGGKRLNEIQMRIIKYAKSLTVPNVKMYVINNNCLSMDDMSEYRQLLISKILRLYNEINIIMTKYPNNKAIKIYLKSQYDNISKSVQNVPGFERKIYEDDFDDFSMERLNLIYEAVNKYYKAILKMTNEKSFERVELILGAVTAVKRYVTAKTNYDNISGTKKCKTQDETKKQFQTLWETMDSLFRGYDNYRSDLRNLIFDNITDAKLKKVIDNLNELSEVLDNGSKNC